MGTVTLKCDFSTDKCLKIPPSESVSIQYVYNNLTSVAPRRWSVWACCWVMWGPGRGTSSTPWGPALHPGVINIYIQHYSTSKSQEKKDEVGGITKHCETLGGDFIIQWGPALCPGVTKKGFNNNVNHKKSEWVWQYIEVSHSSGGTPWDYNYYMSIL